jgi:hypothetical protein
MRRGIWKARLTEGDVGRRLGRDPYLGSATPAAAPPAQVRALPAPVQRAALTGCARWQLLSTTATSRQDPSRRAGRPRPRRRALPRPMRRHRPRAAQRARQAPHHGLPARPAPLPCTPRRPLPRHGPLQGRAIEVQRDFLHGLPAAMSALEGDRRAGKPDWLSNRASRRKCAAISPYSGAVGNATPVERPVWVRWARVFCSHAASLAAEGILHLPNFFHHRD